MLQGTNLSHIPLSLMKPTVKKDDVRGLSKIKDAKIVRIFTQYNNEPTFQGIKYF